MHPNLKIFKHFFLSSPKPSKKSRIIPHLNSKFDLKINIVAEERWRGWTYLVWMLPGRGTASPAWRRRQLRLRTGQLGPVPILQIYIWIALFVFCLNCYVIIFYSRLSSEFIISLLCRFTCQQYWWGSVLPWSHWTSTQFIFWGSFGTSFMGARVHFRKAISNNPELGKHKQ